MTTSNTRSSVPPAARDKIPGPKKAGERRKQLGKKPDSDRNEPTLLELRVRSLPGSFSDTYPEATDDDCEGNCDCWGDNNPRLTKEERDDANEDNPYASRRVPENTEP